MSALPTLRERDERLYVRREKAVPAFPELSIVKLSADALAHGGGLVRSGTSGAVVAVWNEGEAYEVEFADPVGTLATVKAGDLRAA